MIKTGIDLILNKRITSQFSSQSFLKKVFHAHELRDKKKLPGIFALKEALMKALGKKINWLDIEIKTEDGKKPEIILSNSAKPKNLKSIDCSVSHDGDYTTGIVMLEF